MHINIPTPLIFPTRKTIVFTATQSRERERHRLRVSYARERVVSPGTSWFSPSHYSW